MKTAIIALAAAFLFIGCQKQDQDPQGHTVSGSQSSEPVLSGSGGSTGSGGQAGTGSGTSSDSSSAGTGGAIHEPAGTGKQGTNQSEAGNLQPERK